MEHTDYTQSKKLRLLNLDHTSEIEPAEVQFANFEFIETQSMTKLKPKPKIVELGKKKDKGKALF